MNIKKNYTVLTIGNIAAIALIINIVSGIFIFVLRSQIAPVVPLFYGMPLGEEQLSPQTLLYLPPFIAIGIIVLNLVLIQITKDVFLQRVLSGLMLVTSALSTIAVIKIIILVGSI